MYTVFEICCCDNRLRKRIEEGGGETREREMDGSGRKLRPEDGITNDREEKFDLTDSREQRE